MPLRSGMKRPRGLRRPNFRIADSARSGRGFLLAGPFVVTEEVWVLAAGMNVGQGALTAGLVALIGYAALYRADTDRDPDVEKEIAGIPARFVSLMIVAFGSVTLLALLFDAPGPSSSRRAWSASSCGRRHLRQSPSGRCSAWSAPRPPTACSEVGGVSSVERTFGSHTTTETTAKRDEHAGDVTEVGDDGDCRVVGVEPDAVREFNRGDTGDDHEDGEQHPRHERDEQHAAESEGPTERDADPHAATPTAPKTVPASANTAPTFARRSGFDGSSSYVPR